jgi:1,5-anhydro-D-fructose reductase (1,5-anhydro-D-mannitol-forming)
MKRLHAQRPLRWAFVGASAIADEFMAPALRDAAYGELVAIVSASHDRRHDFGARHQIEHRFQGVQQLLACPEIFDAAYISTTNDSHRTLTEEIATAGRHVLCEKPLTLTGAEADDLVHICARAGILLGTNHHLRAVAAHRRIRELTLGGAIGQPRLIQLTHTFDLTETELRWRRRPEQGGGVILDATTHDIDLVRFLVGSEIVSVSALPVELEVAGGAVEDGLTGWMLTASGVRVSFNDAFQRSAGPSELTMHGTEGSLRLTNAMEQTGPRTLTVRPRAGTDRMVEFEDASPYAEVFDAFATALHTAEQPLASGADGAAALHVAEAIRRSAATGGLPVAPAGVDASHV